MNDLFAHLIAAILGIVEGLTEFLPVSSTGHLILADAFLPGTMPDTFETMIQLGAILAVVVLYFPKLWGVFIRMWTHKPERAFAIGIVVAFLPAMLIGAAFHDAIKAYLFSPFVVAISLFVGGIIIILAEKYRPKPIVENVDDISLGQALKIGLVQCFAMIPGVSRSGATIIGAMMMGIERKAAAEFSFFLAIPTMLGVFVYEAISGRDELLSQGAGQLALVATGFVVSFISALLVIKPFLAVVQRVGFLPFAYYRIVIGILMLAVFWPKA